MSEVSGRPLGLSARRSAAAAHFMATLRATASPPPRRIKPRERWGVSRSGSMLSLVLVIPLWLCLAAVVWAAWPVIRDGAAVMLDVLRVVGL